jgi:hypothetical protein
VGNGDFRRWITVAGSNGAVCLDMNRGNISDIEHRKHEVGIIPLQVSTQKSQVVLQNYLQIGAFAVECPLNADFAVKL